MHSMNVEVIVPYWVNWIAVDQDGTVWGFNKKPFYKHDAASGGFWDVKGFQLEKLYIGKPPKNWRDELYTWGY